MTQPWKTPVTWFALFNLLGAPFIGRAVWFVMQRLDAESAIIAAVAMSLVGAVGILGVNSGLSVWAGRAGLPRKGQTVMWLITGGTFVLTIGFGFFSPVNLAIALLRTGGI
ncbi:MAG TPA: hypothetical protein VLA52_05895 [Thermohalobaculum sp.]|nr:hypothetical protein [Thermohalobaculum sp.]